MKLYPWQEAVLEWMRKNPGKRLHIEYGRRAGKTATRRAFLEAKMSAQVVVVDEAKGVTMDDLRNMPEPKVVEG